MNVWLVIIQSEHPFNFNSKHRTHNCLQGNSLSINSRSKLLYSVRQDQQDILDFSLISQFPACLAIASAKLRRLDETMKTNPAYQREKLYYFWFKPHCLMVQTVGLKLFLRRRRLCMFRFFQPSQLGRCYGKASRKRNITN